MVELRAERPGGDLIVAEVLRLAGEGAGAKLGREIAGRGDDAGGTGGCGERVERRSGGGVRGVGHAVGRGQAAEDVRLCRAWQRRMTVARPPA